MESLNDTALSPGRSIGLLAIRDVFVGWLACTPLALLITAVLSRLDAAARSAPDLPDLSRPLHQIGSVAIGPLIETLLMLPIIWLIARLWPALDGKGKQIHFALISAAAWAAIHGAFSPLWAIGTFWPFVVFSYLMLRWRSVSVWMAVLVVTLVHALHNASVVVAVMAFG